MLKNDKYKFGVVMLIFFAFTGGFGCSKMYKEKQGRCDVGLEIADKYVYTFKPGDSAWVAAGLWSMGSFDPLDSIFKLCQVPAATLATMSTLGVIQSIEENPFLGTMRLRESYFQGRDEVVGIRRLNANEELLKRTDAAKELITYYRGKNPVCGYYKNETEAKRHLQFNWYYFDMICTQPDLLNKMDRNEKKEFARVVKEKRDILINYPDFYEGHAFFTTALILSQIMLADNFTPYITEVQNNQNLRWFVNYGVKFSGYEDYLATILSYTNSFLNS